MKEAILDVKDIFFDKELYPRNDYNWRVAYIYAQAMKSGSIFPLIKVAKNKMGRFVLIDGKHRLEANKINKEKYIKAIIYENLDAKQIYLEAIKANTEHGYQFAPQEKAKIILRLRDMKLDDKEISSIIHIPLGKMQTFVAERIVSNFETNKNEILKAPFKNLAGTEIDYDVNKLQDYFSSSSQFEIIEQTIKLLENPKLLKFDSVILSKLVHLKQLIEGLVNKKL